MWCQKGQKLLILWHLTHRQLWSLKKTRVCIALSPPRSSYELLSLMLYLTQAQALTSSGLYRSLRNQGHVPAYEIKLTSDEANDIYIANALLSPCSSSTVVLSVGSRMSPAAPPAYRQPPCPVPCSSLGFFFPDHLFSVFSISQDGIPAQEHPMPGPPHVGASPASPRWLHKGKPKISTGDRILFVASPSGWGRVTSILQIQSFVFVPMPCPCQVPDLTPCFLPCPSISSISPHPTQILSPRYR